MMKIDDEGEGGVWPMMTSSQKHTFLVNFWDFTRNFSKIFLNFFSKFTNSEQKFSCKFKLN